MKHFCTVFLIAKGVVPLIGFIVDFCFEVPLVIVPGKRTIHVLEMEDVPEFEGFV